MSSSLQSAQAAKVLRHMAEKGPITPKEALREYGCMRLAARIHDLRLLGVVIEAEMVYSGRKRYARYVLADSMPANVRFNLRSASPRGFDGRS